MDQSAALALFESLSSPVRLDVFRLLVRAGPDGAVAGQIAAALDVAPSSLSFHLRTLTQSGLLTVQQEGRFLRYRADLSTITGVIDFLTENCCTASAVACAAGPQTRARVPDCQPAAPALFAPPVPVAAPVLVMAPVSSAPPVLSAAPVRTGAPKINVLFVGTGNSCRSILAEATFNALAPGGARAMSAGSQPAGYVHPRSLALLAREGIPIAGLRSKSWDALPAVPDLVVTVCASAAGENCPVYLGPALRAHWSVPDPVKAGGTAAQINAGFEHAYRTLRARIEAYLALPEDIVTRDPAAFHSELERIGKLAF